MRLKSVYLALPILAIVAFSSPVSAANLQVDQADKKAPRKLDGKNDKGKKLERAEQFFRNPARLDTIKTIGVVPVVIQLGFDKPKCLPDPARMRARIASAELIPDVVEELGKSAKYTFVPVGKVTSAMADMHWMPTDLYSANRNASWDSPAEIVKGGKKDEADLSEKRDDMKRKPDELALYRYRLHDAAEPTIGLASCRHGVFAQPDVTKIKELAAKLGVDALLFVQVTDVDVYESTTGAGELVNIFIGPFGQRNKSTRIHLQGTLVDASDNAILWRARARGIKSQATGIFHAGGVKGELTKRAADGTIDAIEILLSDLCEGTGTPQKQ